MKPPDPSTAQETRVDLKFKVMADGKLEDTDLRGFASWVQGAADACAHKSDTWSAVIGLAADALWKIVNAQPPADTGDRITAPAPAEQWFVERTPSSTAGYGFIEVSGPHSRDGAEQIASIWRTATPNAVVSVWERPRERPLPATPPSRSAAPQVDGPIQLNEKQKQAVKEWAADDRLWTTQETVDINLGTFARVILRSAAPQVEQEKP